MKKGLTLLFVVLLLMNGDALAQRLVDIQLLESRTKAQLQSQFGSIAEFGADLYRVTYETPDIYGELDTASGLFIYPVADSNVTLIFPMLIYQHGTVADRNDVPSELEGGYQSALYWASAGYATTAADYLGMGTSRGFHPYVHAETEASAAIDMHIAVEDYCQRTLMYVSDQLFITGYSQGGHAAAAAQKKIQEEYQGTLNITASAPMSGPYSISGVMRELILSDDQYFFVAYAPNTLLSYNLEYNFFQDLTEVFKEPVANWVQSYYDEQMDLWQLNQTLIAWLIGNYGASVTRNIFQDSFINAIETDLNHPVNQALQANDLINWAPEDPTRLFYCMADDQVPFTNSLIAKDSMMALGATDVDAIDVSSRSNHTQCVNPAFQAGYTFFSSFQKITMVTSTTQLNQDLAFSLSPNPTRDWLDIRFEDASVHFDRIEIIAFQGQNVKSFTNQKRLDVSDLTKGIYLVKVVSGNGVWIEKFLKQ